MLKEEHTGFVITFEVMATLFMFCVFTVLTLYILRVMNIQRYMNTVMTSTAAQASRWGGFYTNAYKVNVNGDHLLKIAQDELDAICPEYHAEIIGYINDTVVKASHNANGSWAISAIENDDDKITVSINYSLPPIFSDEGKYNKVTSIDGDQFDMYESGLKDMSMSISVQSIMEAGKLLRGF